MNWQQVQDRMSTAPARIGGYTEHGRGLEVGSPAHVTVINPNATYRVDRDQLESKSRNTPFHGMELQGQVVATFFHGRAVFADGRCA
jgi:dihydroorotase